MCKYVLNNIDKDLSILDFGAGLMAIQTKILIDEGYKSVTAYEFEENSDPLVHDKLALSRKYDVVMASNVLNVQPSADTLIWTLLQIDGVTKKNGIVLANYPISPRKAGMSVSEMGVLIGDVFGTPPIMVGGEKRRPLWKITK